MDRAKFKRWFPECHVPLHRNATSGFAVLLFPCSLCPFSCLAAEEGYEEKLVSQQEVIPQGNHSKWRSSRKKGLPPDLKGREDMYIVFVYVSFLVFLLCSPITSFFFFSSV